MKCGQSLKFFWIVLGVFIAPANAFCQDQKIAFKDYYWPERIHYEVVPEEWEDEDAVMLQRTLRHRLSSDDPSNISNQMEYYYLIKLLSQKGVEEFAKVFIPVQRGTIVSHVAVRIYKPDGRMADFNGKYFKSRVMPTSAGPIEGERYVVLDIPTAEKGDELEIYFRYEGYGLPVQVFFHDYLPILRSEYLGQWATKFEVRYKGYNGVPEPEQKTEYFEFKQRWVLSRLPAHHPEPGAWAVEEYPYLDFALKPSYLYFTMWKHNWTAFFSQLEQNQIQYNNRLDRRLEKQLKAIWSPLPPNNALIRLETFHNYVSQRINVVPHKKGEMVNLGNDLEYGRMSQENLLLLYDDIIRRFNLDYELIFAKTAQRGTLDTALLSLDHVSHYVFRVRFEGKTYLMPVPTFGQSYPFNALPAEIQGTTAIVVSYKHEGSFTTELLSAFSPVESRISRNAEIRIPMQSLDVQFTETGTYSGAYYSKLWGMMSRKYQNANAEARRQAALFRIIPQLFSFDMAEVKPLADHTSFSAQYMVRYPGVIKNADGTIEINLEPLLYLPIDMVDLSSRNFGYHPPYSGAHQVEYSFLPPPGYTFFENESGNWSFEQNGIASVSLQISVVEGKATVRLTYFLEKDRYEPGELSELNAVYTAYTSFIQKKLLLQRL